MSYEITLPDWFDKYNKKSKYTKEWWFRVSNFETNLLTETDLEYWLSRCKDDIDVLIILLLYYTGSRPTELTLITWDNFSIRGDLIAIKIPTLKRGFGRTVFIPINKYTEFIVERIKSLDKKQKNNLILQGLKWWNIRDRIYRITENEMCPYFFRHNRLSQLAEAGATIYELKYFKGAKKIDSVEPYITRAGTNIIKLGKMIK
ncbi:MAG: tyrosine-type recombinase/integrase [Candidatus Aenigmatarchaeota archaeon]